MGREEKLLEKARSSPNNFKFSDLCSLAEHAGFVFRRQKGSHKTYRHPELPKLMMNFQPDPKTKCMAKTNQVRQLLSAIDDYDLIREEG